MPSQIKIKSLKGNFIFLMILDTIVLSVLQGEQDGLCTIQRLHIHRYKLHSQHGQVQRVQQEQSRNCWKLFKFAWRFSIPCIVEWLPGWCLWLILPLLKLWGNLKWIFLLLSSSGLASKGWHSVDGESLSHVGVPKVNILNWDYEVSGGPGGDSNKSSDSDKDLKMFT